MTGFFGNLCRLWFVCHVRARRAGAARRKVPGRVGGRPLRGDLAHLSLFALSLGRAEASRDPHPADPRRSLARGTRGSGTLYVRGPVRRVEPGKNMYSSLGRDPRAQCIAYAVRPGAAGASPACACHPRVAYASRHTPHARGPTAETSLDVTCLTCGMCSILESIADKRTTPGGDRLRCPNYPARSAVSVTLLSPRSNGSDLSLDFRPGRISKLHQRCAITKQG